MPLLGAHMSIAGGYHRAAQEARRCGCDVVQLFTAAPQQWPMRPVASKAGKGRGAAKGNGPWRAAPISDAAAEQFASALVAEKIGHPIVHACYLINLASPDEALRRKSIAAMVVELTRADRLKIPYVIVHPGAHLTASEEEGLTLVAASIDEIHRRLPRATAQITLELTAGQGTCLGWKLEHLAAIIEQVKQPARVQVCLDTCHVFAAGYDLGDRKAYLAMWRQFDRLLGLDRLKAIHLNDSKRELGSRIDRHEHIGRGQIGLAGFRNMLCDKRLGRVPMYLETPKGDCQGQPWDVVNLRTLRELAAE
jgi:deoxyribonuclease-4